MNPNLKALKKEFDWLMNNRKVRIIFRKHPDVFLRLRNQSLSENKRNNINDLISDTEILKSKIKQREQMLKRKVIYSRNQNNIDIQQVVNKGEISKSKS